MKISCQSCQSKYTIADDKVSGKVVKIRCKKCGATIVVNGSDGSSAGAQSYVPDMPAAEGGWMVNVAEGDQRTMTDEEVVAAFQSGVVNDETFCWRDGMADWLPLREIEQLSEACNATSALQAPPVAAAPAPAARAGRPAANGGPEPVAAAPAARRVAGRQGGDLFSSAAQAGGEDDVMTSAPVGAPQARPAPVDDKMVGERNENSVLFSLSALTSKGTGPTKPTNPGVEASGLIDIRQLSAQLNSPDDKKRSRIDDIMNLAGGGAFSPSLSGPILSAPAVSEYTAPEEAAAPAAGQSRGRGVVIAAAAAGVLVIVGAIGTAFMMMKGKPDADKDKPGSSASAGEMASAPGAAASAAAGAAPSASAAPAASDTATAAASASAAPEAPAAQQPKVASNTAAAPKAAPKETPAPAPAGGNSLQAAMAGGAAPAPAAAAGGGGAEPFNMGEAKARLAAAAAAAQGCKKGDGPTGTGRVVVMFAPSGAAQSATVSGPPFEGTPTGACVAARFRGVHVPAFSGSPFSVSKSFSINSSELRFAEEAMATGLAVIAAFLLGLRVGIAVGHRSERSRKRDALGRAP
jgi:predicted Zn finger-like uncharacterized protein